ncbi:MAG: class II fructose-bisphosphate aldolase [Minisyncoccia bacterium]
MRSLKQAIKNAEKGKIAIGHFNISNLEQLKAIAEAVRKLNLPVIIGVSEGEREYIGVNQVKDLIDGYNKEFGGNSGFWLFLNADHTHSLDKVQEAAAANFDEILFDGGKLLLEENIKQTKQALKIAKPGLKLWRKNILIEGELGYIGSASEIRKEIPEGAAIKPEDLTKPEEAAQFVKETGVDLLAPAVGNIHGMYANISDPALDIERIRAIKKAVKIPLVLHGASGNTESDLLAAIDAGISIIHISTELRAAWREGLEKDLKEKPDEVAPYKLTPDAIKKTEEIVERKLRLFNKL